MAFIIAALNGDASGMLSYGLQATQTLQTLSYSREEENQADEQGLAFLQEAGMNPRGMMSFIDKLSQEQEGTSPFRYFSTHSPITGPLPNDGIILKTWLLLTPCTTRNSPLGRTGKSSGTCGRRSQRKVKNKTGKVLKRRPGGMSMFSVSVIPDSFHRESILAGMQGGAGVNVRRKKKSELYALRFTKISIFEDILRLLSKGNVIFIFRNGRT